MAVFKSPELLNYYTTSDTTQCQNKSSFSANIMMQQNKAGKQDTNKLVYIWNTPQWRHCESLR